MKNKPRLILLHGIHQSPMIMKPLANKLTDADFDVFSFNYASVFQNLEQHSIKLNAWLVANHDAQKPIYMVGHSLGGLVIRDFISRFPEWKIDNCVTLGTPHLGSVTADYAYKWLPFMLGKAFKNGLDGNLAKFPDDINLGVIAGNFPRGLGAPFITLNNCKQSLTSQQKINDGTVYVSETLLAEAKAHIVLPVSHTGMLVNAHVAEQTIHFLKTAQFL